MSISALIPAFVATADAPFNLNRKDVVLRSELHFQGPSLVCLGGLKPIVSVCYPQGTRRWPTYQDPSTVLRACYVNPNIDSRSCSSPLIDVQNLAIKYDMRGLSSTEAESG